MTKLRNKTVTEISVVVPSPRDVGEGFIPGRWGMKPVRALKDKDLDPTSKQGKKIWQALSPKQRQNLLNTIELRRAVETRDLLALKKFCRFLTGGDDPKLLEAVLDSHLPKDKLAESVSEDAAQARLILRWTGKRFLPALLCPDIATALYVRLLLGIVGGKALRVCPYCSKPFVQGRTDQDYCSIPHREAHRVRRWRAAQKTSKPGRKKPSKKRRRKRR